MQIVIAHHWLGIDLLGMTTIENLVHFWTLQAAGIYLLEMTTIENYRLLHGNYSSGIYLLEMITTENGVWYLPVWNGTHRKPTINAPVEPQRYLPVWNDSHRKLSYYFNFWWLLIQLYLLKQNFQSKKISFVITKPIFYHYFFCIIACSSEKLFRGLSACFGSAIIISSWNDKQAKQSIYSLDAWIDHSHTVLVQIHA